MNEKIDLNLNNEDKLNVLINKIEKVNTEKMKNVQNRLNILMKPEGSLGILERLAVQIAGITGDECYSATSSLHIVAASDNGVVEENVSSCPLSYTRVVSESMLYGTAAIGILANNLAVDFKLVDVGIIGNLKNSYPNLYINKVREGSNNFTKEGALKREEVVKTILNGIEFIKENSNYSIFSNGEMGIGNTTTSSAILYSLTKGNIDEVVGRGGGLSDESLLHKKMVIKSSCEKYDTFNMDPIDILAHVGGLDISFIVGMYLGCGIYKKPMIIDGFISAVSALVAVKIAPNLKEHLIPSHISEEPGMKKIMKELDLFPPLNFNMRLGEGTGGIFMHSIIKCALEIPKKMKTPKEILTMFN